MKVKTSIFIGLIFLLFCFVIPASADMDYYIEPDANLTWIKIPYLPPGTSVYSVQNATNAPSGINTFDVFEDFDNGLHQLYPLDANLTNAPTTLTIPTYDGSGQVVHPDVLYFENTWGGYEYWMVMTPYPNTNNVYENPSLVASHDGLSWVVPAGITNPIVPKPTPGFNHDPDMVYNNDTNELWVYYGRNDGISQKWFSLVKVNETFGLSDVIELSNESTGNVSESIIKDGDTWHMWKVRDLWTNKVNYCTSVDGITWSEPVEVSLNSPFGGVEMWHINVERITDKYLMTLSTSSTTAGNLFLAIADVDTPTNFTLFATPIIRPSGGNNWDSTNIYRASTLYNVSTDTLNLYYSARNGTSPGTWGCGRISTDYSELINDLSDATVLPDTNYGLINKYGGPSISVSDGILSVTGTSAGIYTCGKWNDTYMMRANASLNGTLSQIGFSTAVDNSVAPSDSKSQNFLKVYSSYSPNFYGTVGDDSANKHIISSTVADGDFHTFEIQRNPGTTRFYIDLDTFTWGSQVSTQRRVWMYSGGESSNVSVDWYMITQTPREISYTIDSDLLSVTNGGDEMHGVAVPVLSDDLSIHTSSDGVGINACTPYILGSDVEGNVPFSTQLRSVYSADSYAWDFENDGIIDSTKRNPVHTYGKAGTYTVNLTVQNEYGNFSTVKTDYITVSTPAFASDPVAWFNWVFSYLRSMYVSLWVAA